MADKICEKCNGIGMVPGIPKVESVINGAKFEYARWKYCDCLLKQKEQQVKSKIQSKSSWVDKYAKEKQCERE